MRNSSRKNWIILIAICVCTLMFGGRVYAETPGSDGVMPSDSLGVSEGGSGETDRNREGLEPVDLTSDDTDESCSDPVTDGNEQGPDDPENGDQGISGSDQDGNEQGLTDPDAKVDEQELTDPDAKSDDQDITDPDAENGDQGLTETEEKLPEEDAREEGGSDEKNSSLKETAPSQTSVKSDEDPGDPDEETEEPEEDGWHTEEETGRVYYIEDGERVTDEFRKIDEIWWEFDSEGYATELSGRVIPLGQSVFTKGDRVWFWDAAGGVANSDLLIVESDGHWGLIDTGNRYTDTIVDEDGTVYDLPYLYDDGSIAAYSCQVQDRNGRDAAIYMIETLGVTHVDFIVTSHAHSDHSGGIPDIAELLVEDETGIHYLIDENTVYLKKAYYHINTQHDDLGDIVMEDSWHTQAYDYAARQAILDRGGTVIDVSQGQKATDGPQTVADYDEVLAELEKRDFISNADYNPGDLNDYYDDYLEFYFGNFQIRLYNLYPIDGNTKDENPNSIAAVISNGIRNLFTAGDLNVMFETQQKVARAVYRDFGNIDIMKSCDHGASFGFSREMLDLFQPGSFITTCKRESVTNMDTTGGYFAALYYTGLHFGTIAYEVGAADKGIVVEFGDDVTVSQLTGAGTSAALVSAEECINRVQKKKEGWVMWKQNVGVGTSYADYYYFRDGVPVTGWLEVDGEKYYLQEDGFMYRGLLELDGKKYFLKQTGEMLTGWLLMEGYSYFFDQNSGAMVMGWVEYDGKKYYMDAFTGIMCTGFMKIGKDGYYFDANGSMFSGWKNINGSDYYFGEDGRMVTGWLKWEDQYYYLPDGWMLTGWAYYGTSWYYLDGKGVMVTAPRRIGGKQYIFLTNGKLSTGGWYHTGPIWYLASSDGSAYTGWKKQGGSWYYLDSDGIMQTGWKKLGGKWYYFASGGQMQTGWKKIDGKWYCFSSEGAMSTGWVSSGSDWYYFTSSGNMISGWKSIAGRWYYFDTDGRMVTGWRKLDGKWYYLMPDGRMAVGKVTIGGKEYSFRSNGVWIGETN